jgi:hypothetical protein
VRTTGSAFDEVESPRPAESVAVTERSSVTPAALARSDRNAPAPSLSVVTDVSPEREILVARVKPSSAYDELATLDPVGLVTLAVASRPAAS